MTKLEELRKVWNSACVELVAVRDERSRVKRERDAAFEVELEARFGEMLRNASAAEAQAEQLFIAEQARVALEKAQAKTYKVPVGSVLHEWTTKRFEKTPVWTGRRGVLEIISPESSHPGNLAYGRARIGDVVVRLLKKDGSPGQSYVQGWNLKFWAPEGTDLAQGAHPELLRAYPKGGHKCLSHSIPRPSLPSPPT